MKYIAKKTVIATVIVAILLSSITIITVATPAVHKERKDTEYATELSYENWTPADVYADGYKVEAVEKNGQQVTEAFAFEKNDVVTVAIPEHLNGKYKVGLRYHVDESAETSDVLFSLGYGEKNYTTYLPLLWKDQTGEERYPQDRYGNERANMQMVCTGSVFSTLQDNADINQEDVTLELSGGTMVLTNMSQPVVIEELWFYQEKEPVSYDEYLEKNKDKEASSDGAKETITVQGEDFSVKSDSYIRSANVNQLSLTPYDTYRRMINVLDGSSFGSAGQQVMWEFTVEKAGWYELGLKFCQNSAVNKQAYREIKIDGEVPFEEFSLVAFPQTKNQTYKTSFLADSNGENYRIYLTEGRHTLSLKAEMGQVKEVYEKLKELISDMNVLGMDITKITAGADDKNRTWNIDAYLPNAVGDIEGYIKRIDEAYDSLEKIEGEKPSYAGSLLYAKQVLEKLLEKPRLIPNRLELFNVGDNSAVKHINTVLNNMIRQDLGLDEFYIKPGEQDFKEEGSSFAKRMSNSVRKFLYSLDPKAVEGSSGTDGDDEALTVWMSRSSIYVQVLQSMADSAEELKDMKVNISIMPSEDKLVLAAAAGSNPDVVLGAAAGTPYKFAIRGAAKDLTEYEDFLPFYTSEYNMESLVPCAYDGGVYGAIETQDFSVLFYRKDILESLGVEVPDTWDDVQEIMPTLLRYNKNISIPIANLIGFKGLGSTAPFIYQNNGELYTENGAGAAFMDTNDIEGMNTLIDLFKVYAVQEYVASAYNSFRYGDTPLAVGGVSMYVQLTEAAPELAGLWGIAPIPGTRQADGSVRRDGNYATTSCMIFDNTKKSEEAWRFLKWWLSSETQTEFASIMELSYGTQYRWNTANLTSFMDGSYSDEHKEIIMKVWEQQKENLQHPASYIVERELSNAFTNAVVNGDSMIEALDAATLTADREIMRKLKEFGYVDSKGELIKDYPTEVMNDIKAKLEGQTKGGAKE